MFPIYTVHLTRMLTINVSVPRPDHRRTFYTFDHGNSTYAYM